jgi:hypothetical protein
MIKSAVYALFLIAGLVSLPAPAQSNSATMGFIGCGNASAKFDVDYARERKPAQPDAGKALVYFIEKDSGAFTTPTTMAGLDGKWIGATSGNSYFHFSVDPGVHHLCATTRFGGWGGAALTAVAHFTADAGSVYYFEVNNISWTEPTTSEVNLLPLDSDEGQLLASFFDLAVFRQKK